MARNLTPSEKLQYKSAFPNMNVDAVLVTAEATPTYNCLAWTLGITNSWVWPWGGRNATKAEFDALYRGYGFTPSTSGTIAAWGIALNSMTHGSLFSYPFNKWESKCGAWARIIHSLPEMEGTTYGSVQYYFSKRTAFQTIMDDMNSEFSEKNRLSEFELEVLQKEIQKLPSTVVAEFETKYDRWKKTWQHPLIAVSSNPGDRANSIEFLELVSMGKAILPLLINKLKNPEEFFALQAVDRLLPGTIQISRDFDDDLNLLGEQGRALETVKLWVISNL